MRVQACVNDVRRLEANRINFRVWCDVCLPGNTISAMAWLCNRARL